MKLAIMQPYFAPYVGYFALIRATDRFIGFDDAQYIRHGWVNRNRILHPAQGWQYIVVPVRRHSQKTAIRDIVIATDMDWKGTVLRQLAHYQRRAPHFRAVMDLLEDALDASLSSLAKLNMRLLGAVCRYLGLRFDGLLLSEANCDLPRIEHPGQWALEIASRLGASSYLNPIGGRALFSADAFSRVGVALQFLTMRDTSYDQRRPSFEANLSIVDVLMFNSPEEAVTLLDRFDVLEAAPEPQAPSSSAR